MACYFDEHDCEPLPDGQAPDHLLHLARFLIDGGYAAMSDLEFDRIFQSSKSPPPASKEFIEGLKTLKISDLKVQQKCPVCISEYDEGDEIIKLPCLHSFHAKCIIPWLNKTSSCPLCRHEFPTDDEAYEEYKKQKAREKQRQFELESLHDSMFG